MLRNFTFSPVTPRRGEAGPQERMGEERKRMDEEEERRMTGNKHVRQLMIG